MAQFTGRGQVDEGTPEGHDDIQYVAGRVASECHVRNKEQQHQQVWKVADSEDAVESIEKIGDCEYSVVRSTFDRHHLVRVVHPLHVFRQIRVEVRQEQPDAVHDIQTSLAVNQSERIMERVDRNLDYLRAQLGREVFAVQSRLRKLLAPREQKQEDEDEDGEDDPTVPVLAPASSNPIFDCYPFFKNDKQALALE